MKLNKQIFGWLGASALLLTAASCTNDNLGTDSQEDQVVSGEVYGNGSKLLTVSINAQGALGTRGDDIPKISDGSKADQLILQVWEGAKEEDVNTIDGNSVTYVPSTTTTVNGFPATIKLSVDPDKYYRIALWAQSSSCDAYDTSDLSNVKVIYPGSISTDDVDPGYSYLQSSTNNDENRDAFCATETFSGSTAKLNVTLHRPFAQLNIGTTGADYKNYQEGNIYPHRTITYSQVVIKGVSTSIDVANDKIGEENATIIYKFAPTIAEQTKANEEYLKVKLNDNDITSISYWDAKAMELKPLQKVGAFFPYKEDYPTIRAYNTLVKESEEWVSISPEDYNEKLEPKDNPTNYVYVNSLEEISKPYVGLLANVGGKYQYQYQKVNGELKKGNNPFIPDADKQDKLNIYLTEEFKYLSMCYILVPSPSVPNTDFEGGGLINPDSNYKDEYHSSTLDSVEVYFAESEGDSYKNDYKYFTVNNVPVHRNWRTNLLGGLADPTDPKDPNGPDDETSLFYNTEIAVYLCPIYYGEYNGVNDNDPQNPDHYKPLWGGWFPTTGDDTLHKDPFHPKKD